MPRLNPNETLDVRGTVDFQAGTILLRDGQIARSKLTQEDLVVYPIPFTNIRVWDSMHTLLPGTAATDDLGLIGGAFGTAASTIQSGDGGGATINQYGRFRLAIPAEYVAGQTAKIRARATILTTIADDACTVDFVCYKDDEDGGISGDIINTAATSINVIDTPANCDFDFTTAALAGLAAGDMLDFRVHIYMKDAGNLGVMIGEISLIALLLDIKG